jgi:Tfp pilus assembly protein PilF
VARGDAERGKADAAAGEDVTIANPARLPPPLREAVCEQCHLSGAARVVARGRTMHDFRPGLPLHGFVATFVETAANPARRKFVGQAEQMRASRCYQQSQGQLSCTSCHDPHAWPAVDAKLAFYRRRCLACHERQTCSLPEPQRLQKQPADDCTACHMPKQTTEVRHAAVSDHRVPRVPADEAPAEAPRDSDRPIRNFHSDQLAVGDREAERNLAIALLKLNDERHGDEAPPSALQRRHTRWAIETLQAALQRHPDDHDAAEVLARALADEGQLDDALRLLESLLAEVPRREFALTNAAALWMSKGRSDKALAYWHRAVQINPWMVGYRVELARVHGERRDWQTCRTHCREILETFPESFGARTLLVESLLALREPAEAEREFQKLLSFGPPKPENIRRWYEQHPLKR